MNTQEIANQLVDYCRKGDFDGALDALYSPDAVSVEPDYAPVPLTKGLEGLKGKSEYFKNSMTVHDLGISDPIVAGNFFTLSMWLEVTEKENGKRYKMEEVAVYEAKDGKIVKEQFFF